jgi:predicted nuclease of predicted toxin-antitoxin system
VRLKLDENLATRLVPILSGFGHDVDTVVQEGLGGRNDRDLWPEVQKADRFLITKDLGFSDERQYPLASVFETEPVEAWTRCLVIVSDHKVRVRRPRPTQPTPTE